MYSWIEDYRRDGFVKVEGVLSREEALEFRGAALNAAERLSNLSEGSAIFSQFVNVWTKDEAMRRLTLHPEIARIAKVLTGTNLRIWHDQILIKEPGSSKPTEFHQDKPYWPHLESPDPISCWIALGDVPVESGCMTFLPGKQNMVLDAQDLSNSTSLFDIAPQLKWSPRVTLPLRAGDVTFHHGRCPHMASSNLSSEKRVAHVVIFMQEGTAFSGVAHPITQPLSLEVGDLMDGDIFPLV